MGYMTSEVEYAVAGESVCELRKVLGKMERDGLGKEAVMRLVARLDEVAEAVRLVGLEMAAAFEEV